MTNHHISAEQMIVEEDRREIGIEPINARGRSNTRSAPHDYSKPQRIVYVPVEPEPPEWADNGTLLDDELARFWDSRDFKKAEYAQKRDDIEIPFSPQDIIEVPSMTEHEDFYENEMMTFKQYEVIKVLGVQEKNVPDDAGIRYGGQRKWHFQLLCEETK